MKSDERGADQSAPRPVLHGTRMEGGIKLNLIETLLAHVTREPLELHGRTVSDDVRGCLLAASSTGPSELSAVDRIEYAELDYDDGCHRPYTVRGIALAEHALTIRELIEELHDVESIPPRIAARFPRLSLEDFQAGLFAVQCVLYCLEGSSSDERRPLRFTASERERTVAAHLRSLESFRRTGEP